VYLSHYDYEIGDLVVLRESVEWDNSFGLEGEIGVIIEIYEIYDEENFFDLLVALGDGNILPVWVSEVEKLDAAEV